MRRKKILSRKVPIGGLFILFLFILVYLLISPEEIPGFHLILGLIFVYLVGVIDDLKDLKLSRFVILQLLAISYLAVFGIRVGFITNPVEGFIFLGISSIPVTIAWVFTLVNMINLLEGLRGLSVNISLISSFFILIISWSLERQLTVILVILLLFALIIIKITNRFFNTNFRLGSSGSMLVGSILAIISISGAVKSMAFFSLLLPVIIMGVPLLNGIFALWNGVVGNSGVEQKNKLLHHLLIDWGLTVQQSRYVFYVLSFIFGLLGLVLVHVTTTQSLIIIIIVSLALIIIFQELSRGNLSRQYLDNVKLLKDIQLVLYQIRDEVQYKKVNGEMSKINDELSALKQVISGKIPDYLQKAVEEISVNSGKIKARNTMGQLNSCISFIEEIFEIYSQERENLDYILRDYKDELQEIVFILNDIYSEIK